MTKWMNKEENKQIKEETKSKKGYAILKQLFEKYNVDFTKSFKITNWNESDQKEFHKGMKFYGYEKLINKYL